MQSFDSIRRAQLAALETSNPQMAEWLRGIDAVYLYGSIGTEAALFRDETVRFWVTENWDVCTETVEREGTPLERIGAIVLGSRRIPELRELLPVRPDGTPDCARCNGGGEIFGGVLCPACGGLGWEPKLV
jgi:hypothetical protein